MFDLLLLILVMGIFVSGFIVGAKYQTAKATWTAFTTYVESWFK